MGWQVCGQILNAKFRRTPELARIAAAVNQLARLADMPQLAEHFLERALARHDLSGKVLSDEAMRALLAYGFPDNVHELENMIERAVVNRGRRRSLAVAPLR